MTRLFQARISFMQDVQDGANEGSAWLNMQVSRKGVLWWNPRSPAQGSLWNSWIELERDFYEAITAAPIPIDVRALRALKRSPLTLDLYALLCYEVYRVEHSGRARFIPWRAVAKQLGADYEGDNAAKELARKARAATRARRAGSGTERWRSREGAHEHLAVRSRGLRSRGAATRVPPLSAGPSSHIALQLRQGPQVFPEAAS